MDAKYLSLLGDGKNMREEYTYKREDFLKWVETAEGKEVMQMRRDVGKTGRRPVDVVFSDVSVDVPRLDDGIPSVGKVLSKPWKMLIGKGGKRDKTPYRKLHNITGRAQHGEMLLVLAPPASGCSSLLRVLAGYQDGKTEVHGSLKYNGTDYRPGDFSENPVKVGYISEEDHHLPALAVKKTFTVAAQLSTPMEVENRDEEVAHHVERVLSVLGLSHVGDTVVGNALLRGVSGGERKRVSIGEAMLLQGQFTVFDGWSRGLDSATALHIGKVLRAMVNLSGAPCISSLYQAGPDLFSIYDKVLVLKDGRELFYGVPHDAVQFLTSQGIEKPFAKTVPDFLTTLPVNADELSSTWEVSSELSLVKTSLHDKDVLCWMPDGPEEQPSVVPTTAVHNMKWLFWREYHLTKADMKQYIAARIGRYIFQGLLLGALFFQLSDTDHGAYDRMGLLTNTMNTIGTGTFALMPEILDQRAVFNRHKDAKMFHAWTWPIAKGLWDIPLGFAEALIFASIVYWMTGLYPAFSHYAATILIMFLFNAAMANIIRLVVYISRDTNAAQAMAGSLVTLFNFFSGFAIAQNLIPKWWKWVYYITPFSYAYKALCVNEFNALTLHCTGHTIECITSGREYINSQLGIDEPDHAKWYHMLRLAGYTVGAMALGAYGASKVSYVPVGNVIRRKDVPDVSLAVDDDEQGDEEVGKSVQNNMMRRKSSELLREAPPAEFTWRDVSYTVKVKGDDGVTFDKPLLKSVNGFGKPGKMVALMGPTGAGKTTLLDVLARRKTSGVMDGEVALNGEELEKDIFRRVTAYVEQEDLHTPRATVREAVRFSSTLRCKNRKQAILVADQTVKLLGLDPIADAMIGSWVTGGGISLEALKRVTIAVELVADPSVLFMDEPTSGLDSEGALVVMNSAREIADQGRTVICTIHQPSAELFSLFDSVLLLHEGRTAYFGEVGEDGATILEYFKKNNANMELASENPAESIMTFVKEADVNWADVWEKSTEGASLCKTLKSGPELTRSVVEAAGSGRSIFEQLGPVMERQYSTYDRMPTYNLNRMGFTIFVSTLFGSTYWDLGHTVQDLHSYVAIIFVTASMGMIYAMTSVQPILEARPSFYRETLSGTYSALIFAITIILNEIPWVLLLATTWANIIFWMAGLPSAAFPYFYLQYINFSFFMQFLGLMVASAVPSLLLAQVLLPVCIMIWQLHAGFLILTRDIPAYLIEFNVVNPVTYFLRSEVVNILHHIDYFTVSLDGWVEGGVVQGYVPHVTSDEFLDYYGWGYSTHDKDIVVLAGASLFCATAFVVILVNVRHIKR